MLTPPMIAVENSLFLQPTAAREIPAKIDLDESAICWHKHRWVFLLTIDTPQCRRLEQGGSTMSLFDIRLKRSSRFFGTPTAARFASLRVEVLEERQCPSVASPTGLTLTALSSTQVKLTWTNPAGSLGTIINTWNGSATTALAYVGKGVTTYTVNNLTPNQVQWFAVTAYDSTTSAQSAWQSITTPANAITAPTNVRAAGTQNSVSLAWTNGTGETGYRVYRWNGTSSVLVGTATPSSPAITVTGLTSGASYYFYVQAYNATNSVSTSWITASTTGTSLSAPTNLKTSVLGSSTVALSWNDSVGETGYKVYQWNGSSLSSPVLIATLAANTTGYQAVGLLPGQTYYFYVQAYNAIASANTAWVSALTTAVLLQPPTHLAVQPNGATNAILSWTGSTTAAGYRILEWNGYTWSPIAVVSASTHQYDIAGLSSDQTNWLMVESFTTNYAETAFSRALFVNL
jgi:hypothetical protein